MEGIIPFVNAGRRVTVTLLKTIFTKFAPPKWKAGKTLPSTAKRIYSLRGRGDVGDQLNTSMERHRTFYSELSNRSISCSVRTCQNSNPFTMPSNPYSYFSISLSKLMSLYSDSSDYRRVPPRSRPRALSMRTREYTELDADETALRKLVFDVWYTERQNSQ